MEHLCQTYEEWKHCITVKCQIPLTSTFIAERIKALSDAQEPVTARFVKLYGDPHRVRTLRWFEQARRELNEG